MAGFDPDVFGGGAAQLGYDSDVFSTPANKPAASRELPKKVQGSGSTLVDAGNAVGTGYFRGLTRLAGLPVDTVANVIDLGKAGLGSAYQAVTGKTAPDALQLSDRKQVVGSGDWLLNKLGQTSAGNLMVNPVNPDYEGGYSQALGGGLTAVMGPGSGLQAANQAGLGAVSALGGKAAMDITGNPALAVTASLAPYGAQQAVTAATKGAVRGANPFNARDMEAKSREMQQRIQDLKNAGIENPTLGLASGNKMVGGMENLLQSTPGAVGVMGRAREAAVNGLQAKADEAAQLSSMNRGTMEAGRAVQGGITGFKDAMKERQAQLYGRMDEYIDPQQPASIGATKDRLAQLNSEIRGAPELSKQFQNARIMGIEDAIKKDTAGAPQSVQVYTRPAPQGSGGVMNSPAERQQILVTIPEGPPRNTLPFEAVKKTRTLVGNEIADNLLTSTVPQSKWRALYGALSEDLGKTAADVGPPAERAFNRATDYTRAASQRLERVAPFAQMPAPEQAFTAMERAARENVSTLQAVKKALPQDARGAVAGTIIERLGKATNANQNNTSTAWSPETFLTNWNKMTPKAREELFSGFQNAPQVKANVEAVAKATSMMRDSSKMWANPSGSGANLAARMTIGGLGAGGGAAALGLLNPALPLTIGGGLLGTNMLARGLTSPKVVNAMARQSYMSPELLAAQVRSLVAPGLLTDQ